MGREFPKWRPEAVWFLCMAALFISFFLPLSALPSGTPCWFYNLTHIPCPGCGLTRAFFCISHGHWGQAWRLNPFGFAWYGLVLYGALRPFLLRKAPAFLEPFERILRKDFFFPTLVGLMFLVWVYRLGLGSL